MMANKIKQISKYGFYVLWSNVIYGLIVYHVFIWLAKSSLLYAYLWNLALIILGLAIDRYIFSMLQSEKFVLQLKQEKDMEKNYRVIQWVMDSFVSFKCALYLFYIFILVVSKITDFYPEFIGKDMTDFIHANDYSILFLLAFDTLMGQFSKDRDKMKKVSEKLRKSLAESQEE